MIRADRRELSDDTWIRHIAGVILVAGAGSHTKCSAFLKKKAHFPKLPTGQQVCPQRPLMAVYVGKVGTGFDRKISL
ncbi:MAG TPA: hypothetical protein VI077_02165 [Pseudolabrys sp.]